MTDPQDQGDLRIVDRRLEDRRNCWLKVKYRDKVEWRVGIAADISREGVRVVTLKPLKLGAPVTIVFEDSTETQSKTMRGTVAWQNCLQSICGPIWQAPGMGIRFAQDALSPAELQPPPDGSKFDHKDTNISSGLRDSILSTTSDDVSQDERTTGQAPAFLRPFRL